MNRSSLLPLLIVAASALPDPAFELLAQDVQYPLAVALQEDGTAFVADRNLPGVWKFQGPQRQLFFQGDRKFRTPLNAIRCLAIDRQGHLLAGDSSTRQVYRFGPDGRPVPLAQPLDASTNLGPLGIPMGIAVNRAGEILISDREFRCIFKMAAEGGTPQKLCSVEAPAGLAVDANDQLWVVTLGDQPLLRVSPDGKTEPVVGKRTFDYPHSVAIDPAGVAYVVDGYKKTVWRISPGQDPEPWFTHEQFQNPVDIKLQGTQLVVVDPRAKALFRIGLDGQAEVQPLP